MRQLKGQVKKETKREKRERKKDFLENKQKVFTIVLPVFILLICLIITYVYFKTKPVSQY
uniref:Single-pass membrane and coiled-coil domain-containing protein 4 homolog n=1 Tax=Octopus bimaculoides TaxID=37653 RepID=A0A0L8GVE8_OCTBM